jgi:hypothetical protein
MRIYLIVDETDGSVVAECEQVEDVVRTFATEPARPLRVVVFQETGGALERTETWVSVRTR